MRTHIDTRAVFVPRQWRGFEYEYRLGYAAGRERNVSRYDNPVGTHCGVLVHERRLAWEAGRRMGRIARADSGACSVVAPGDGPRASL